MDPGNPQAYSSITNALTLANLQQGDQVVVVGLKVGNLSAPYSDTPLVPGQTAESFPLQLPQGIRLAASGTNPVLIARTLTDPEPLIQVIPSALTGPAVVEGLRLLGGEVGICLDSDATGAWPVEILACRFIRNGIGISAIAEKGAEIFLLADGCVFEPSTGMIPQPVLLQTPAVGIRMHAVQNTSESLVPRVDATIRNGNLKAGYPSIVKGEKLVTTDLVPAEMDSGFSRFLEVYATGHDAEHRLGLPPAPIAEVTLEVEGGTWRGGRSWDVFVYSTAVGNSAGVADYTCGYDVRLEGPVVERFAGVGAVTQSGIEARGRLDLSGGAVIRETGFQETRPGASAWIWTGVFGQAYRGYLGITGTDFDLLDNTGHGLFLTARDTKVAPGPFPVGSYLGIDLAEIHGNAGAGIYLRTAEEGPSIVGGTWHEEDDGGGGTFRSLIDDHNDPTDLPHGQGFVYRCAVSNNGEYGVSLRNFVHQPSGISCQFVNDVIWNQPLGGIVGFSDSSSYRNPLMAVPIHGCTIAGNGSMQGDPFSSQIANYNVEFFESSYNANNLYEWTEQTALPNPKSIGTRITNSILIRKSPGPSAIDFGQYMVASEIVSDTRPTVNVPDYMIGIASVRRDPTGIPSGAPLMTTAVPQFVANPVDWTSRDATQFSLIALDPNSDLNNTRPDFLFGLVDVSRDFLDNPRDAFDELSNPSAEMGAFELPGQ